MIGTCGSGETIYCQKIYVVSSSDYVYFQVFSVLELT